MTSVRTAKTATIRDELPESNRISNGPNIYQIGAEIGRGGFAVVFQAFNVETGDFVAIKRFPLKAIDDDSLSSIESEIELMQKLNHPNIVKYIDTIRTRDYLHIVLEYMENGSLSNVIKKFGSFSESLTAIYVTQVLRGLKYLHEQGVLHRDIKGANILTTKDGMVKLADFGVAMKLSEAHENDQDVVGSPYWIAPEIIEMSAPTAACDIWSVGCIIIELLTRKPPYYDLAPMAALFRIVQDDYPPLPEGISQALRDFLLLCFQKEPVMRSSAAKLLEHPWLRNSSTTTSLVQTSKLLASKSDTEQLGSADSIVNTIRNYQMETVNTGGDGDKNTVSKKFATVEQKNLLSAESLKSNNESKTSKSENMTSLGSFASVKSVDTLDAGKIRKDKPTLVTAAYSKTISVVGGEGQNTTINSVGSGQVPPLRVAVRQNSFIITQNPSVTLGNNLSKFQEHPDEANFDDLVKPIGMSSLISTSEHDLDDVFDDDFIETLEVSSKKVIHSNAGGEHSSANMLELFMTNGNEDKDDLFDDFEEKNVNIGDNMANKLRQRMQQSIRDSEQDGDLEADEFINYKFDAKDFKQNEMKDVHFRRSREVVNIMSQIRIDTEEVTVIDLCSQLMAIFTEFPEQRDHLVTYHGVMPIIDMIEARSEMEYFSDNVTENDSHKILQPHVLRVINKIIEGSTRAQEQLSLVGIIPTIMNIFGRSHRNGNKKSPSLMQPYSTQSLTLTVTDGISNVVDPVTLEAARFIHLISSTSSLTLQMLIGAGGLSVLTNMVSFGAKIGTTSIADQQVSHKSSDSSPPSQNIIKSINSADDSMAIFQMGIDCITHVFSVQSSRTRDFCRLFVKLGLLRHLSIAFQNILALYLLRMNSEQSTSHPHITTTDSDLNHDESWAETDKLSTHHRKTSSDTSEIAHHEFLSQSLERKYTEEIAMLFFKFSRSDSVVAEMMAHEEFGVVTTIISALNAPELRGMTPPESTTSSRKKHRAVNVSYLLNSSYVEIVELLLKCVKNLSMEPSTLLDLENAGVIQVLIPLLSGPFGEKCKNHILPALFNICRINKRRQEQASLLGIIPHLKKVITDGSHLRQFALPILFDLAHTSSVTRTELWKNDCVTFYLDMLKENYWQTFSLNSLAIWLSYDCANVSKLLVESNKLTKLVDFFRLASINTIQSLHKPLYDIMLKSKEVSRALACSSLFVTALVKRLNSTNEAIVLRSLLKMLQLMHQYHPCPRKLVLDNDLYGLVKDFAQSEGQVLVCQIANRLLRDFQMSTLT